MNILFCSHAADMDGVASMLLAKELALHLYEDESGPNGPVCTEVFADYDDAFELLERAADARQYDAVFLCDLSWREDPVARFFPYLPKDRLHFYDHHHSTRAVYEGWKEAGYGRLAFSPDGDACTADLVWAELEAHLRGHSRYFAFKDLVDVTSAGDLWKKDAEPELFAEARSLASVQSLLGCVAMLDALEGDLGLVHPEAWGLSSNPYGLVFQSLLEAAESQNAKSLATAKASLRTKEAYAPTKRAFGEVRVAWIVGNASEVGNDLVGEDVAWVVLACALTRTLSFRSNPRTLDEFGVTCADIARRFGGGGHPLAAGAPMPPEVLSEGISLLAFQAFDAVEAIVAEKRL